MAPYEGERGVCQHNIDASIEFETDGTRVSVQIFQIYQSSGRRSSKPWTKPRFVGSTPKHRTIVFESWVLHIIPCMKNRSQATFERIDPKNITLSAPTVAVTAIAGVPEYIRLPKAGENDPLFGLSRSYVNLLVLPSIQNRFQPPVRSSVLRQGNSKTGVRLISVASLKTYLDQQTHAPDALPPGANSLPATSPAEFIRLPKVKERDPLFGLSRSFLNELNLPYLANKYKPPVQSHVLRRRGYRNGIRLISVDSLRNYIKEHEESAVGRQDPGDPRIEQGDI